MDLVSSPTSDARERTRRRNRALKERQRRAKGTPTREQYLAAAYSRTKPWLRWGLGRRQWERRGKPIFDETPSP
jgi:hypothetical protein